MKKSTIFWIIVKIILIILIIVYLPVLAIIVSILFTIVYIFATCIDYLMSGYDYHKYLFKKYNFIRLIEKFNNWLDK